jgi:GGDEF domain-containing protein
MEFFDIQTGLMLGAIATTLAAIFLFAHARRSRHSQGIKIVNAAAIHHSTKTFAASHLNYAAAKKLAAEWPPAVVPLVAVPTNSRPPVQARIEREPDAIEMAPPSPPAPSGSNETHPSAAGAQALTLPPFTIDAVLWERLISSLSKQNPVLSADGDPKPIDKTPPTLGSANTIEATRQMIQDDGPNLSLEVQPRGMIQPPVLEKWLESQPRFTGLVVSIGINDSDSSIWHSQGLMQSVGSYIAGLLRATDYCCRTAYDEFLMVCPGEQGAQSQRRLNHISERLWDYQLTGIRARSILFSWGGVQVQDQPLAEAIASATERMRETKRTAHARHSAQAHLPAV